MSIVKLPAYKAGSFTGFFVDARNKNAKAYYEQFGFIPLPDRPLELFLPLATLQEAYYTVSEK